MSRAVLWLLITVPAVAATAEEKAQALYEAGVEAFRDGEYADALEKLETAYKLDPSPVLIYNLARAHEEMGHAEEAAAHYRMYLDRDPEASDRADVERRIRVLTAVSRKSEPGPEQSLRPWAYASLAGAVAATAAGVVLGLQVSAAEDEHAEARTGAERSRTADDAEQFALFTNVSYGAAIVLAGVGATLWLLEPDAPVQVQGGPSGASVRFVW